MARSSLSNSPSKLNLSRRQTALFQKIILAGNAMADALRSSAQESTLPQNASALAARWNNVMIELVKMLL